MILQLNPQIPVITPKGPAIAHFIINYGIEHDIQWVCFEDKNGECWTWKNPDIRAQKNITQGRQYISPFYDPNNARLPEGPIVHTEDDHICMICQRDHDCDCEYEESECDEDCKSDQCDDHDHDTYYQMYLDERIERKRTEENFEELEQKYIDLYKNQKFPNCRSCKDNVDYHDLYLKTLIDKRNIEFRIEDTIKKENDLNKKQKNIENVKEQIFELQDLLMDLIRRRKVELSEVERIAFFLKNSGICESDLKTLCGI